MQENTNTGRQLTNVDIPPNLPPIESLDPAVTHGSIAVAIILALAVLIKTLAILVKSCQD